MGGALGEPRRTLRSERASLPLLSKIIATTFDAIHVLMPITGKTTLGWQLKAKVYTDGIKVIL